MQYRMPSLFCNFGCVQCGESCRGWLVEVYPHELKKILEQLKDLPAQEKQQQHGFECHRDQAGNIEKVYTREIGNSCCFLEHDNDCFLHRRLGYESKPSICRSYPFYAIETPQIIYVNGAMSCTAIRSLLRKEEDVVAVFPSSQVGTEISVLVNFREHQVVKLTPYHNINWEGFYFLHDWLFSRKIPEMFRDLDFLWQQLGRCEEPTVSPQYLRELLSSQPSTHKTASPLEHLSHLCASLRYAIAHFQENEAVGFAVDYLFYRLQIDANNVDYNAALRYQEYYARHVNTMGSTIFNNYLRARLFINEFYFSRSILESVEILCLFTGMAHLLALSAAGNSGNLTEEHLLDAIFVIEKYLSHSSVFENFPIPHIKPSTAYAPI